MSLKIIGGGGASTPAFDPFSLTASLLAWYRADSIQGLADAVAVSSWKDISGNATAATQATGTAQPTFRTNVLNGKPVVRFDGGDHLASSALTLPTTWTLFSVAKAAAAAVDQGIACMDDGSTNRFFKHRLSATAAESIVWDTTPTLFVDSEADAGVTSFKVRAIKREALAVTTYVAGTGTSTATTGTPDSGSIPLRLGCATPTPGEFLTGDIAEILLYSGALSDVDRGSVETYLKGKYAI